MIVSPLVALMDDQVKEVAKLGLCAAQLGMHNDREIMEGNFSLIFGIPRILDSQSKMASYVGINTIPRQPRRHCLLTRHTSHTNGEFAYRCLVINFNK